MYNSCQRFCQLLKKATHNILISNKLWVVSCGPVQNRTGIQGFGDPYTIRCTTGPGCLPLEGGRNYELFQQPFQITAEYFDGDGQQHHPENLRA